jgi:hypothetical protein
VSGPAALLLAALAQLQVAAPGELPLSEAPPAEVWASEDWPADALAGAAALPQATLAVRTRSNMLRPEVAAVLSRRQGALVRIGLPLLPAHLEQLRALPRATLVVEVPPGVERAQAAPLARLGPQTLRVRIDRLDEARGAFLAGLKNLEVELDVRGRVPQLEELARRVLRLRASDAPEVVAGLAKVQPSRLVVEAVEDRVPEPMLAALSQAGVPVRVALSARAQPADVRRLGSLPRLSLELALDEPPEVALRRAARLLGELPRGAE